MSAPTSGLARITVRAPNRRLDVAVPDQVPLAEILPDLLRRAGEGTAEPLSAAGGWLVRRADGTALTGDTPLHPQGVRDGEVLYLVPRSITWPEPDYDDVVEEVAASARRHGRPWEAGVTRVAALGAAGLLLLAALAALVASGGPQWTVPGAVALAVAAALLGAGTLLSRAVGDAVTGAVTAAYALPYAGAGGLTVLLTAGGPAPAHLLVGSAALLLAAVAGAVGVGHGLRIFTAGGLVGAAGAVAALIGLATTAAGAAAALTVLLIVGVGLAPGIAARFGKLPLPIISAAPEAIAAEPRPERPRILVAVVRADEVLAGLLLGVSTTVLLCIAVLVTAGGTAAVLTAALAGAALALRARPFTTIAARLPLVTAGLLGLVLVGWETAAGAGTPAGPLLLAGTLTAVGALLTTAATAYRRRDRSPYLVRLANVLDILVVTALPPFACAVLGLYGVVRAWTS